MRLQPEHRRLKPPTNEHPIFEFSSAVCDDPEAFLTSYAGFHCVGAESVPLYPRARSGERSIVVDALIGKAPIVADKCWGETAMNTQPNADRIEQVAFGFMAAKVLFSALELGLFTELANGPLNAEDVRIRFGLHPRSVRDFLDALVALGLLERNEEAYSNTPDTDFYLDRSKPSYCGSIFEMWSARGYGFWALLTEALRTGKPQNEIKGGEDLFTALYTNPDKLRLFLRSMTGHSMPSAIAIAGQFPWRKYNTFVDIGTAEGCLPVQVALANPDLVGEGFDLPMVRPFFEEYVTSFGLQERLRFRQGDFFNDSLPTADVLVMGMILHDWDLAEKRMLLKKAYEALPSGGALIVYEHLIDDERRKACRGSADEPDPC